MGLYFLANCKLDEWAGLASEGWDQGSHARPPAEKGRVHDLMLWAATLEFLITWTDENYAATRHWFMLPSFLSEQKYAAMKLG